MASIVVVASVTSVYGYNLFLQSELAQDTAYEAAQKLSDATHFVEDELSKVKLPDLEQAFEVEQTPREESQDAMAHINEIRKQYGKRAIPWDERVYGLALAWTKHQYDNGFFDHTDPDSGLCPFKMRSQFGLQQYEFVADNAHGLMHSYGDYTTYTDDYQSAISGWMDSRGHRYNLMYDNHIAGAFACTGGACTFMGLNYDRFGEGCSTGAEGLAFWDSAGRQPGEVP